MADKIATLALFVLATILTGLDTNIITVEPMPSFAIPVLNVTVRVNEEARLVCMVDHLKYRSSEFQVTWVHVDTNTILSIHRNVITHNPRIKLSFKYPEHLNLNSNISLLFYYRSVWVLHIEEVQEKDRGWYECQINSVPMVSSKGYLQIAEIEPIEVCIENCGQCKKMLGAVFEGPLCAESCFNSSGKRIPDCENITSISPFLNLTLVNHSNISETQSPGSFLNLSSVDHSNFSETQSRANFLNLSSVEHSNFSVTPQNTRFVVPVFNVTVRVYENAKLSCVVENLKDYQLTWVHVDTNTILSINNPRIRIAHDTFDRVWILRIEEVQEKDRGWYECQINSVPMLSSKGYLQIIAIDPIDVCMENCAQCKKMLGAVFEVPLCAESCFNSSGKRIPDCENITSISPFLNLTSMNHSNFSDTQSRANFLNLSSVDHTDCTEPQSRANFLNHSHVDHSNITETQSRANFLNHSPVDHSNFSETQSRANFLNLSSVDHTTSIYPS